MHSFSLYNMRLKLTPEWDNAVKIGCTTGLTLSVKVNYSFCTLPLEQLPHYPVNF